MSMSEYDTSADETEALHTRLRDIEGEPLESRAPAFAQLHDALHAQLEGADSVASNG